MVLQNAIGKFHTSEVQAKLSANNSTFFIKFLFANRNRLVSIVSERKQKCYFIDTVCAPCCSCCLMIYHGSID